MPHRTRPVATAGLLVAALVLTGCADASDGAATASSTSGSASPSPTVQRLELGKTDVPLAAGMVASPTGFSPALTLTVGEGWTSVHRYGDAFDLGRPDPAADRPLALVAVTVPPEDDAAAALDEVAAARPDADATMSAAELLGGPARQLDLVGGEGPAYASRDDGIALDAAPGQRLRLVAADTTSGPLVVVVLVADDAPDAAGLAAAKEVLDSLALVE